MNQTKKPVAITGVGCITACGSGVRECYDAMLAGVRRGAAPTVFETGHETAHPAFEILGNPQLDARDDGEMFRTTAIARIAVAEALRDAGWNAAELKQLRVGVSLGSTIGCALNNEEFNRTYHCGEHPAMDRIDRYLRGNTAAEIKREFGLSGPCQTVNNACSSGTDAIGLAASWLSSGLCDIVIAGGADELGRITYSGFVSLLNVSEELCRPFDRDRSGLNLGEGAGIVILEARPRQRPKAHVAGYGSACDAHHLTAPVPDGNGLRRAIDGALAQAGCTARDLAFINAHGTGTTESDRVEGQVLAETFPDTPFYSSKGYTGHTLGAAGGIEAVFAVEGLIRGELPASAGFSTPDPAIGTQPITEVTRSHGRYALSQSLAFGGNNSAVLFERAES